MAEVSERITHRTASSQKDNEIVAAEGDVIFICNEAINIRVSSTPLSNASAMFAAMFTGVFSEGQEKGTALSALPAVL